ncbi:hypothetical protein Acid345_0089 [Candidatus Koribacter versatilis Ellin345]|uniref:2TM domain-containing protein n=1 Tax=Koribacter versatilis (strain Ellin345) TaxID=204669 RepID=Q1IVK6_KORVE|nr:hypothetical protein [Candidatus Koribacter versatilis]ABF39094.1 hypothetical protein Acid345_0089 [Candidatus Koribacter versatilis Ellin345]
MFDEQRIADLKKQRRKDMLAKGKKSAVRRQIAFNLLLFGGLFVIDYLPLHRRSSTELIAWALFLPIGILGGYLQGIWIWQDLEKKARS